MFYYDFYARDNLWSIDFVGILSFKTGRVLTESDCIKSPIGLGELCQFTAERSAQETSTFEFLAKKLINGFSFFNFIPLHRIN